MTRPANRYGELGELPAFKEGGGSGRTRALSERSEMGRFQR